MSEAAQEASAEVPRPRFDHRIVYVAHQLSAPTREGIEANRANAARWVCWLAREFRIAPVADWIVLTGGWPEDADHRTRGLEIDCALVARCDEMWMVGGIVSAGMRTEYVYAKTIRDLTPLGYDAPTGPNPLTRALVAEIIGMR